MVKDHELQLCHVKWMLVCENYVNRRSLYGCSTYMIALVHISVCKGIPSIYPGVAEYRESELYLK